MKEVAPQRMFGILMLVIVSLSVSTSYLIITQAQTRDLALQLKQLVAVADKQRNALTSERYELDNFTVKNLDLIKNQTNNLLALSQTHKLILDQQHEILRLLGNRTS